MYLFELNFIYYFDSNITIHICIFSLLGPCTVSYGVVRYHTVSFKWESQSISSSISTLSCRRNKALKLQPNSHRGSDCFNLFSVAYR